MKEKNKYQEALEEIINGYQYAYNYYCQFQGVSEEKAKELFEHFNNKNIGLLKELLSKETPEDVEYISTVGDSDGYPVYDTTICPACDREFEVECEEHYDYCPSCGQKLKWWRDE